MLIQEKKIYTVYKHVTPSGKVYIGITSIKPDKRWNRGKGYKDNIYFSNAINKYGWDNIKHEILSTGLTKEQGEIKEIELIKLYDSTNRDRGYNIENGGNHLGKVSYESRLKMSLSHKGVPLSERHKFGLKEGRRKRKIQPNTGKRLTDEWKKAVALGLAKPVSQFDLQGNLIKTYVSQIQASRETGVTGSNINRCCKGERKTAGGYIWRCCN